MKAKGELQASFPTGRIQPWMHHQGVLTTPQQMLLVVNFIGEKSLKSYLESGWREVCMTLGTGDTPARPIEAARNESEVYISPKFDISAQTLKMAQHKNPGMHYSRVVIFLHGPQKCVFMCTASNLRYDF